jgi:hypothetical protein
MNLSEEIIVENSRGGGPLPSRAVVVPTLPISLQIVLALSRSWRAPSSYPQESEADSERMNLKLFPPLCYSGPIVPYIRRASS